MDNKERKFKAAQQAYDRMEPPEYYQDISEGDEFPEISECCLDCYNLYSTEKHAYCLVGVIFPTKKHTCKKKK